MSSSEPLNPVFDSSPVGRGLNRFFQKEKCYDRRIAVKYDITEEEKESGRLLEARERTLKEDH